MPAKRSRAKPAAPQTLDEVAELQSTLAEVLKQYRHLEDELENEIAVLNTEFERDIGPLKERAAALAKQIYTYTKKHRKELTDGGKVKTATIARAGTVVWSTNPAKVTISGEEEVLARLINAGTEAFLRRKVTIDRQAMLDDSKRASKITGVTISQSETVYLKPNGTHGQLEATIGANGRIGKWKIKFPEKEVTV